MIPSTNTLLNTEIKVTNQPSKNYMLDIERDRISGFCDKQEAMKQVIYKILNTQRYSYLIYSWNYGIELKDLYGQPLSYVYPELKRRITEALTQDDRINSVDNFEFSTSNKGDILVLFTVHTIFGNIDTEKVVRL